MAKRNITVYYEAVDGYRDRRKYTTVKGASKWAREMIGDHPDRGSSYAVSFDGVGTISVAGATMDELFPDRSAAEDLAEHRAEGSALPPSLREGDSEYDGRW